jgi:hypothetical protein
MEYAAVKYAPLLFVIWPVHPKIFPIPPHTAPLFGSFSLYFISLLGQLLGVRSPRIFEDPVNASAVPGPPNTSSRFSWLLGTAVDYAGCVVLLKGKKFEISLPFWSLFFFDRRTRTFFFFFSSFLTCRLTPGIFLVHPLASYHLEVWWPHHDSPVFGTLFYASFRLTLLSGTQSRKPKQCDRSSAKARAYRMMMCIYLGNVWVYRIS